ncbi:unnamed protein product [Prorocentrum cordatum]|uniref:Uncharacterized protein n=1 Tax=Prorocentrum cordatum TaxID=2364126 RepID=A0ABN9Y3V1_9DINO|nr:unnamed protein product [Polarella glacialis]
MGASTGFAGRLMRVGWLMCASARRATRPSSNTSSCCMLLAQTLYLIHFVLISISSWIPFVAYFNRTLSLIEGINILRELLKSAFGCVRFLVRFLQEPIMKVMMLVASSMVLQISLTSWRAWRPSLMQPRPCWA